MNPQASSFTRRMRPSFSAPVSSRQASRKNCPRASAVMAGSTSTTSTRVAGTYAARYLGSEYPPPPMTITRSGRSGILRAHQPLDDGGHRAVVLAGQARSAGPRARSSTHWNVPLTLSRRTGVLVLVGRRQRRA